MAKLTVTASTGTILRYYDIGRGLSVLFADGPSGKVPRPNRVWIGTLVRDSLNSEPDVHELRRSGVIDALVEWTDAELPHQLLFKVVESKIEGVVAQIESWAVDDT